jgi:hypothetical protein
MAAHQLAREILSTAAASECGMNHSDCVYRKAYPNALVRCSYGLLRPEEFCPNKAAMSVQLLALKEAKDDEKGEVKSHNVSDTQASDESDHGSARSGI